MHLTTRQPWLLPSKSMQECQILSLPEQVSVDMSSVRHLLRDELCILSG